ncbi:uncharacterized protein [Diadema setosum]|uniref:uncharacterized protein n=1 Tax=Diadema setosum TaxID=31175 RepID=UPI003B3A5F44
MLGMAKSTEKKPKVNSARTKELSPSKVLAIVANWNNTSPAKPSPRRKRSRDEKLSASVPHSRRQKRSSLKECLSTSSDDDELSSFKAKSFYTSAKRTKYQSPLERREELERLVDAGVDPATWLKSFEELQKDRSQSRSPQKMPQAVRSDSNSIALSKTVSAEKLVDPNTITSKDQKLTTNTNTTARSSTGRTESRSVASHRMPHTDGEIKVTLSESASRPRSKCAEEISIVLSEKATVAQPQRSSPRKSPRVPKSSSSRQQSSPSRQPQRRMSPRKSAGKTTAAKGIQMYVKNLKSGQKKKKKTPSNQKTQDTQSKSQTKKKPSTSSDTASSTNSKPQIDTDQENNGEKTARGLNFGVSEVNGHDISPLERSFDEAMQEKGTGDGGEENGDLMDFLVFHDEDFREVAEPSAADFVQNLLLEIDEDLEEAEAALKPSPRKRKMKTEKESMPSPSPSKSPRRSTPNRKRLSSTPLSSKKSSQPKLDDWLLPSNSTKSSPSRKKTELPQKSEVKGQSSAVLTPVSSGNDSPKAGKSPPKGVKLYPVFTPPTSPRQGSDSPLSQKVKRGQRSNIASPKQSRRSPLLKSLKSKNDGLEQMTLDLGQKRFGAVTCSTCGTVYTAAHPEDEADHARFHKKYLSSIKFPGWKQEEKLEEFHDGRIIVVTSDAPRYAEKKVDEIRELVDRELGFLEGNPMACKEICKTYLFITVDKKVGGCLIAEQITKGYRVIVDEPKSDSNIESQKAWCCETVPENALCGISRIWVPTAMRRRGIASRMMNCLRKNFMYGTILSPDDIAFSDPTPDGKGFATKYTGTPRFLVYKYH